MRQKVFMMNWINLNISLSKNQMSFKYLQANKWMRFHKKMFLLLNNLSNTNRLLLVNFKERHQIGIIFRHSSMRCNLKLTIKCKKMIYLWNLLKLKCLKSKFKTWWMKSINSTSNMKERNGDFSFYFCFIKFNIDWFFRWLSK